MHYESLFKTDDEKSRPDTRITVKATNGNMYRLLLDNVLYIETIKRTSHLIVHTKKGPITINGTLPQFEQKYPDLLLRIHASYLVNPSAISELRRFAATLTDGTELPIPEKKYTHVKEILKQEGYL